MKIKLNNGDKIIICFCNLCKQGGGGKFQLIDKKNKKIYIRTGEQIAQSIKNGRNKEKSKRN